jgi:hypothetical protein
MPEDFKPWSQQEKEDYVKERLNEALKLSKDRKITYELSDVESGDPDCDPKYITSNEQREILGHFESSGLIEILKAEIDYALTIRVLPQVTAPRTPGDSLVRYWDNGVATVNDLLGDIQLAKRFEALFPRDNDMARSDSYRSMASEKDVDFIELLSDLGLVEYDWNELNKQTDRIVGTRIIWFEYDGGKIADVLDRLSGKGSIIDKRILKFISMALDKRYFDYSSLFERLTDWGVPRSLIDHETLDWKSINYILGYYATSKKADDQKMLAHLIEEICSPLEFNGDENKARALYDDINKRLQLQHESIKIEKGVLYRKDGAGAWVAIRDGEKQDKNTLPQQTNSQKIQKMILEMQPDDTHVLAALAIVGMGEILRAVYAGEFHAQSLDLNTTYTAMHFCMEAIINRGDAETYRADFKMLPDNVLEHPDRTKPNQENAYAPAIARLLAKSQKQLFLNLGERGISARAKEILNSLWTEDITLLLENHKKEKNIVREQILAQVGKNMSKEPSASNFVAQESPPPTVSKKESGTEQIESAVPTKGQPYCLVEGTYGYLKFSKNGEKKRIGFATSRHFKLLRCLTDPFGPAKVIDVVFEAIRLPKHDDVDPRLKNSYSAKQRKIELIEYAIGELQKGGKIEGIRPVLDKVRGAVKLELLP